MPSSRSSPVFVSLHDFDMGVHFEIVASQSDPIPPRERNTSIDCSSPTPSELQEFLGKTPRQLLKDCFINFNFDWRVRPYNERFNRIAKICFSKKMEAAGCPLKQALRYLEFVNIISPLMMILIVL